MIGFCEADAEKNWGVPEMVLAGSGEFKVLPGFHVGDAEVVFDPLMGEDAAEGLPGLAWWPRLDDDV